VNILLSIFSSKTEKEELEVVDLTPLTEAVIILSNN